MLTMWICPLILLHLSVLASSGFHHQHTSIVLFLPLHSQHYITIDRKKSRLSKLRQPQGFKTITKSSSPRRATSLSSTITGHEFTNAHICHHHTAIKTRNITNSINFYSLLGFQVETKFVSGPARVAWLLHENSGNDLNSNHCRIELIEVPSYMLNEPEGMLKRSVNLVERPDLLGLNHLALDVTKCIINQSNDHACDGNDDSDGKVEVASINSSSCALYQLQEWINDLNTRSIHEFGKTLRVAVSPTKRIVGRNVYEMAFLFDADGSLVELLNHCGTLNQEMDDGWTPWDGQGFVQ